MPSAQRRIVNSTSNVYVEWLGLCSLSKKEREYELEERDEDCALIAWKLFVPLSLLHQPMVSVIDCGFKHGSQYVSALLSVPVGCPLGYDLCYRRWRLLDWSTFWCTEQEIVPNLCMRCVSQLLCLGFGIFFSIWF